MSSTPSLPTVHLITGGIAENTIVPRSVAAGEADCASDHGADRLGTNSLLDLAGFGRQAAIATAELVKPNSPAEQLPKNAGEASIACRNKFRQGMGPSPTADRRRVLQVNVQKFAPVCCNTEGWIRDETVIDEVRKNCKDACITDRRIILHRLG